MLSEEEWSRLYNQADKEVPADVVGVRRLQTIIEKMGYHRMDREKPIDWNDLDQYFWDPKIPFPYPPEEIESAIAV